MNILWPLRALRRIGSRLTPGLQEQIYQAYCDGLEKTPNTSFHNIIVPEGYGRRLPERVVELLLARLTYEPGRNVLDIGHANIMDCHKKLILSLPEPRNFTGIDIADPSYDISEIYRHSIRADITASGLPAESFDLIWCISTLEHLGMDNSGYTACYTTGERMAAQAVQEILRILAPAGKALITVPFGKYENHGWFVNLNAQRWQDLLSLAIPKCSIREWYFRHTQRGWSVCRPEDMTEIGYFGQENSGAAGLAAAILIRKS